MRKSKKHEEILKEHPLGAALIRRLSEIKKEQKARKQKQLTDAKIARAFGCSRAKIALWKSGARWMKDAEEKRLEGLLRLPPGFFRRIAAGQFYEEAIAGEWTIEAPSEGQTPIFFPESGLALGIEQDAPPLRRVPVVVSGLSSSGTYAESLERMIRHVVEKTSSETAACIREKLEAFLHELQKSALSAEDKKKRGKI